MRHRTAITIAGTTLALAGAVAAPAQATTVHRTTATHTITKTVFGDPCFQTVYTAGHQSALSGGTRVRSVQIRHRNACSTVDQVVTHTNVYVSVFSRCSGSRVWTRHYSRWADRDWKWVGKATSCHKGLRVKITETVHRSFCACSDRVATNIRWRGGR